MRGRRLHALSWAGFLQSRTAAAYGPRTRTLAPPSLRAVAPTSS